MAVNSRDYRGPGRVQGRRDDGLGTASGEGTSASRGVAVLFRDKPDLAGMTDATPEAVRRTGRTLRVGFHWMEQPFSIVNVYAPSLASERAEFFWTSF